MATINCKIGQNSSYYKVYIEYSYTQDISGNTSTITAALKLKQLTDSWDFDTVSEVKVGFKIDGEEFSSTKRININDKGDTGYTITLASGTKKVSHNSSGNKTVTFSCSNTSSLLNCSGYGPGSITLSSTEVTLKTIPRNSKINKITNSGGTTISSANVGSEIKVYYTPTVSSYYHKLLFYVDSSKKKTVELGKAGSTSQKSYSITLPASWMPSITSGTLKCYLYTYSDSGYSTKIGSTDTASISIKVPDTTTYNPTASLAITPTYNNNLNVYLKGISQAKFIITGEAGSGASVSSYKLSGSGVSSTAASTTVTLSVSGTNLEYTATVTDSRDRKATASKTITVYSYSKPTLSNGRITRCDSDGNVSASGTYALGKIVASVQSVSGKNSVSSLTWSYREYGTSSWTSLGNISSGTDTKSSTTFDVNTTYQFRFTVTDAAGTTVNSGIYTMPSTGRPLNIARYNNGLAIGKLSSVTANDVNSSKFECAWPAEFDKGISVLNNSVIFGGTATGELSLERNESGTDIAYLMLDQTTTSGARAGLAVQKNGVYVPGSANDGVVNLGGSERRWNQLYAATSTISTSDRNKKNNIKEMSDTQEQLFSQLKPVTYQFKNGSSGRTHYGFISQDVEDALLNIGLTGNDFAGFCKDVHTDDNGEPVLDENDNMVYDYALRYSEFIALNTYMIQKLQNEVAELKAEIAELKGTK